MQEFRTDLIFILAIFLTVEFKNSAWYIVCSIVNILWCPQKAQIFQVIDVDNYRTWWQHFSLCTTKKKWFRKFKNKFELLTFSFFFTWQWKIIQSSVFGARLFGRFYTDMPHISDNFLDILIIFVGAAYVVSSCWFQNQVRKFWKVRSLQ